MAQYVKTVWQDLFTDVSAANMQKIDDELELRSTQMEKLVALPACANANLLSVLSDIGIYLCTGATNTPGNGTLIHHGKYQTFLVHSTGLSYQRAYVSSAWTAWDKLLTVSSRVAEGWTTPTLSGSWVAYDSLNGSFAYKKDSDGVVWVRGAIKGGTSGQVIYTMPTGYRPSKVQNFSGCSGNYNGARIRIGTDGTVEVNGADTSLITTCFSYRTD